jgi:thymidylate kinase
MERAKRVPDHHSAPLRSVAGVWRSFMILIFEGADLVGKSTLAERFSAVYSWPIVKIRWALIGDPTVETRGMARATIELLHALKPDVIFDRVYFSWWAYAPDLSGLPEIIKSFDRVSQVADTRLVLLTASKDEIQRRYEREPDLYFPLDVIQEANERFPSLLRLLPDSLASIHIDTTDIGPDEAYARVESFIATGR